MYTAPGIITLIVAALVGTVIGNLVQLRYFVNVPVMKSPLVRYGSLVLAILLMLRIIPDPDAQFSTSELLSYGLWWVLIAFLVSFVRPPVPLAPRQEGAGEGQPEAGATDAPDAETIDAETDYPETDSTDYPPADLDEPAEDQDDRR